MASPFESLLVRFEPAAGGEAVTVPAPADLRFDTSFPGGFKGLSCTVSLPPGAVVPAQFSRFARVSVVDRRHGGIVWYGRLTDPGLNVTAGGTRLTLTAEGEQAQTDGWRDVYCLVDRSRDSWQAVGDYQGVSQSFGGDLTPGTDVDLTGFDDITVDLSGEFGFGDVNIDLGNLGIDLTGVDFPSPADFPGYLGYLKDPLGNVGDMLPIPLGGTPPGGTWWDPEWEPGYTSTGASATGTTYGVLTVGSGGGAARHKKSAYGGAFVGSASTRTSALFRLASTGAVMRLWVGADTSISSASGYYVQVTETELSFRSSTGTVVASTAVTMSVADSCVGVVQLVQNIGGWVDVTIELFQFSGGAMLGTFTTTVTSVPDGWWGVESVGSSGTSVEFDSATSGPVD